MPQHLGIPLQQPPIPLPSFPLPILPLTIHHRDTRHDQTQTQHTEIDGVAGDVARGVGGNVGECCDEGGDVGEADLKTRSGGPYVVWCGVVC